MRIKTFTAEKMEDALRLIRQQLGPEALILSTRKITTKSGVPSLEITAAVEETQPQSKAISSTTNFSPPPHNPTFLPEKPLHAHHLHPQLQEKITQAMPGLSSAGFTPAESLEMLLQKLIPFQTHNEILQPGKAHLFIGPHGAGKTTLVAKLAIHSKKQGRSVGMLSLDDQKIAGFEPLSIAADLLGDSAHLLTSQADLRTAATEMGPRHMLLLDTPGLNPYQPETLQQLQQRLSSLNIPTVTHLVIPASLNADDMSALPIACHRFAPTNIIFTKLDSTTRYGALASTAAASNLSIGLATHSPDMATPPLTLTAQWLAEALSSMPHQPWEFSS